MVVFIFIQIHIKHSVYSNSGEPDRTPCSAVSELGLHCLHMSHKKDASHIWVKAKYNLIFQLICRQTGRDMLGALTI